MQFSNAVVFTLLAALAQGAVLRTTDTEGPSGTKSAAHHHATPDTTPKRPHGTGAHRQPTKTRKHGPSATASAHGTRCTTVAGLVSVAQVCDTPNGFTIDGKPAHEVQPNTYNAKNEPVNPADNPFKNN